MELLFKIVWICCLALTLYILSLLLLMDYLSQSTIEGLTKEFTIFNFLIPNLISIILLGIYTKELLLGYNPKNRQRNSLSLLVVTICCFVVIGTQFEYYKWILEESTDEWYFVIPLIIVLTSMLGLLTHRISNLNKSKYE